MSTSQPVNPKLVVSVTPESPYKATVEWKGKKYSMSVSETVGGKEQELEYTQTEWEALAEKVVATLERVSGKEKEFIPEKVKSLTLEYSPKTGTEGVATEYEFSQLSYISPDQPSPVHITKEKALNAADEPIKTLGQTLAAAKPVSKSEKPSTPEAERKKERTPIAQGSQAVSQQDKDLLFFLRGKNKGAEKKLNEALDDQFTAITSKHPSKGKVPFFKESLGEKDIVAKIKHDTPSNTDLTDMYQTLEKVIEKTGADVIDNLISDKEQARKTNTLFAGPKDSFSQDEAKLLKDFYIAYHNHRIADKFTHAQKIDIEKIEDPFFKRKTFEQATTLDGSKDCQVVIVEEDPATKDLKIQYKSTNAPICPKICAFLVYDKNTKKYKGYDRDGMDRVDIPSYTKKVEGEKLQDTVPTYYEPNLRNTTFNFEAGKAEGNCAPESIAEQLIQKEMASKQTYYKNKQDWENAIQKKQEELRNESITWIVDNQQSIIRSDAYFNAIVASFQSSVNAIGRGEMERIVRSAAKKEDADKAFKVFDEISHPKAPPLTQEAKEQIIFLYTSYAIQSNKYLDTAFFMTLPHLPSLQKEGIKVVIMKDDHRITPENVFCLRKSDGTPIDPVIDPDKTLFIHYNGTNHYQSINRAHPDVATAITNYHRAQGEVGRAAIYNFYKAWNAIPANPDRILDAYRALKDGHRHTYRVLGEIAYYLKTRDRAPFPQDKDDRSIEYGNLLLDDRANIEFLLRAENKKFFDAFAETKVEQRVNETTLQHGTTLVNK